LNKNISSVSQVVSCGRTERQTDMTKLIVVFRNFANAPKKKQMALSTLREEELDVMVVELVAMADSVSHFW
jgi:hypothetical protein